jgi:hypothetical protein
MFYYIIKWGTLPEDGSSVKHVGEKIVHKTTNSTQIVYLVGFYFWNYNSYPTAEPGVSWNNPIQHAYSSY